MSSTAPSPDRIWEDALADLGFAEPLLLAESNLDPFRRVYRRNDEVFKIVLDEHEISSHLRRADLRSEFQILQALRSVRSVPAALSFREESGASVLQMKYREGDTLTRVQLGRWSALRIVGRLTQALLTISLRGIAHNDLRPDNVIVSGFEIALIDFDQASKGSIASAFASNFALSVRPDLGRYGSLARIASFVVKRANPRLAASLRKLKDALTRNRHDHGEWPAPDNLRSKKTVALAAAWRMAAASNASALGISTSHHSLDIDGVRLPGEKPWEMQWLLLRDATDYSGKRVLELGCNLGLLSTWLLMDANADATLGVDQDSRIVTAAENVAAALGVDAAFAVVNFDRDEAWENDLRAFRPDIVTALNVHRWLQEPERLLSFLGEWPELLFEGDESVSDEYKKLSRLGFRHIRPLAVSKRGRTVFHASKW